MQTKITLKNLSRALRLSFLSASILPFLFGSLIPKNNFNIFAFILGLSAVFFTHLSANLANDYYDSKSGADWKDKKFYGFFGGSKLIQEGIFTERFYLQGARLCAALALVCVILLALILKSTLIILAYLLIIILSWQYTAGPLKFSYRYLGELSIFLLFGPALVMGGYFIQTGKSPDLESFILSFPFGLFTAAILFSNEIPDFSDDQKVGKNNLVTLIGLSNVFVFYYVLVALGFFFILLGLRMQYLNFFALFSFLLIPVALRAGLILRRDYLDKVKLVQSSKLTIILQSLLSIILILGVIR